MSWLDRRPAAAVRGAGDPGADVEEIMWPARDSGGRLKEYKPAAETFAVSHGNTTDMDYAYDAEGHPMSTGLRVRPRPGHEPELVRTGVVEPVGKVARVVRNRRPGRPAVVWVAFSRRDRRDETERIAFAERDLLVVGSASGM